MGQEPLTLKGTNGGRYIKTNYVMGLTVGLVIMGAVGWGKWLQETVINDHDQIIRITMTLDDIDRHIINLSRKIDIVLEDHIAYPPDK